MTALLTSELRKVTTLRFWWALVLAPLAVALFAASIYAAMADGIDSFGSDLSSGAASVGLFVSVASVVLFAGLFGALNAGTEFRHSTLTPTFLTARGRDGVVAAKLIVTAGFGAAYTLLVEIVAVACMVAFAGDGFDLTGSVLAMLGAGLLAGVAWSLIGAGLGLLLRSSIGAAIALVVWYPMGELIVTAILFGLGAQSLPQWLPGAATWATIAADSAAGIDGFAPWLSAAAALIGWAALAAGLGWWTTRSRDVT
ncbi:ABC transporter permease [Rhodococcus sp. NPDC127528]|uniref:ABC transporter permease n=1 Tax=unclassified Rhodococcus (in: high G+C Gram-positive bacteria) TaxID=192944 RepID=UPI00363831FF